jgi:SAM-dependent methyltransferase
MIFISDLSDRALTGDYNNPGTALKMARGAGRTHFKYLTIMSTLDDAKAKATAAYNAAADFYDDPANSFWDRFGRRTIDRLQLPAGACTLDVCCGSGASAIPAAEKVGPQGFVLGIDLAEN